MALLELDTSGSGRFTYLAPVLDTRFELKHEPDPAVRQALQQLANVRGDSLNWWPETVLLRVDAPPQLSLIHI